VSEIDSFKEDYIKGYVDPYINRLLDLRNIIKNATSYGEIAKALDREKAALRTAFPELIERKNAQKDTQTNT